MASERVEAVNGAMIAKGNKSADGSTAPPDAARCG